jgi:hypothetical protein
MPCTRSCDDCDETDMADMDAYGVTARLHNCTMMCSLRDEVSQDVSNLQTSKLKPAVQQNRTDAPCFLPLPLLAPSPCPALPSAHVTAL